MQFWRSRKCNVSKWKWKWKKKEKFITEKKFCYYNCFIIIIIIIIILFLFFIFFESRDSYTTVRITEDIVCYVVFRSMR